jgi:hypothetical protein
MNLEHNNPSSSKNTVRTIDKSRRSFAKAGMAAPVIMTLASKSALGSTYQCTISGAQSGNTSTHPDTNDLSDCAVGFSPIDWKDNASLKTGNGNVVQWCQAGVSPYEIKLSRTPGSTVPEKWVSIINPQTATSYAFIKAENKDGKFWSDVYENIASTFGSPSKATTFNAVFLGSDITKPILEVLASNPTSLEGHAIADYLNASLCLKQNYFQEVYKNIHPSDIVNLYFLAKNPNSSFESYYSHRKIDGNFNGGDILGYLAMIHS